MAYKVEYKSSVFHDIKNLDKALVKRILDEIDKKLSNNPDIGVPLTGQFKGMLGYRVGDYRIIYAKLENRIAILRVGHRKKVYRD